MGAEVRAIYGKDEAWEISVDYDGFNYLVIFGHHINGWFIAIPNHGISCEAAEPLDVVYNANRLARVIGSPVANEIAYAINAVWRAFGEMEDGGNHGKR